MHGRVWQECGQPYWKWLVAGILCTIIAAAAETYSITLVNKIVEGGIIERNMGTLYLVGLQVIAAYSVIPFTVENSSYF